MPLLSSGSQALINLRLSLGRAEAQADPGWASARPVLRGFAQPLNGRIVLPLQAPRRVCASAVTRTGFKVQVEVSCLSLNPKSGDSENFKLPVIKR